MKQCAFEGVCGKRPSFNSAQEKTPIYCADHKHPGMVDVGKKQCAFEAGCGKLPSFNFVGEKTAIYCADHAHTGMVDVMSKKCAFEGGCGKRPSFNFVGEKPPIYCADHAQSGMVAVTKKQCAFEGGCGKRPSFNFAQEKTAIYCGDHKHTGMVNVRSKQCALEGGCGKQPSYNFAGEKTPIYCADHAQSGMVDVRNKQCAFEGGCGKLPSYNFAGEKTPIYCADHKHTGMVDVKNKNKQCAFEGGCGKQPSFNFAGEKPPIYCADHAQSGMVAVTKKRCAFEAGCGKQPSFNFAGEKTRIYCADHKHPGMVDVTKKRCAFEGGCGKRPSCNFAGEKTPIYCADHKHTGMVDVTKKQQCAFEGGCGKQPSFNFAGEKTPIYCADHAQSGMVDVRNKQCAEDGCKTLATYGWPGAKATHCAQHKSRLKRALVRPRRRCRVESCANLATHGSINGVSATECAEHALPEAVDLVQVACSKCGLLDVVSEKGWCCDCDPEFLRRRHGAKQRTVEQYLRGRFPGLMRPLAEGGCLVVSDKVLPAAVTNGEDCTRLRPDLLSQNSYNGMYVALETDENQHENYDCVRECVCAIGFGERPSCKCDRTRMLNITEALQGPVLWIRYNPDGYTDANGKRYKEGQDRNRLNSLGDAWERALSSVAPVPATAEEACRVTYLFFDGWKAPRWGCFPELETLRRPQVKRARIRMSSNMSTQ